MAYISSFTFEVLHVKYFRLFIVRKYLGNGEHESVLHILKTIFNFCIKKTRGQQ